MGTAQTYEGLKVLELATTIAGPFSTMILADLGADVVKVERPGTGDDARAMLPLWDGESTVFLAINRNKRSLVLDLKTAAGREAFLHLASSADVVVQSFRPGAAEGLGLGFEQIRAVKPDIVYASVSAFGAAASGRSLAGYDPLIQAFTGLMSMTGHPASPPVRVAASLTDLTTGMWAAMGVMAALTRRAQTGQAQFVEATLVDSGYMLLCHQIMSMLATGEVPGPLGSGSPIAAPYEAFSTSDGWVMVAAGNQDLFQRLCSALDLPSLATDERFATMAKRVTHRDDLHTVIEERLATDSSERWIARISGAGVPVGPVNDLATAVASPVVEDRGLLVAPEAGAAQHGLKFLRLPFDRSKTPRFTRPPHLGQHSEEVLREAGFSPEVIRELAGGAPPVS